VANQYFVLRQMPEVGALFMLDDAVAAHHIFTVMRAKMGDTVRLAFDGGVIGLGEVASPENRTFVLKEILPALTELPVKATVAVGFPKGDKLELIAEKSTELGANAIWAAPFEWSVVKWNAEKRAKRTTKLEKIARSAAEQSLRQLIPQIALFESLSALIERFCEFDVVLVAYEESAKQGESSKLTQRLQSCQPGSKILLIFGPEGGISPQEIEAFTAAGAECMGLGPRILRAETAPLYALSALSALTELS
jgi:16S rRNA (uracil1498-N3)-methyltransferase